MSNTMTSNEGMRLIADDDSRFYRKGKSLGKGNYGEVFEVTNSNHQVQKVTTLSQDWSRNRELQVWRNACKGTKHVARVYDASFNRVAGEVRIYTELLEGGDVKHLMLSIERHTPRQMVHPAIVYLITSRAAGPGALRDLTARDPPPGYQARQPPKAPKTVAYLSNGIRPESRMRFLPCMHSSSDAAADSVTADLETDR
ncbi:uncharacterized protein B0H64DRAFT_371634 [Chaetomium fimeti]|uniref:Protein kinase domain-containing protein n=1 Tax=Chaetomium fimeti TaxID=1854472 RepID=A0AAE0HMG5_9PEZI|nr:hypothetical protein B0H64DRAFT_371634 [Chaetomium fimeti]